jgi:hypothetical protein
MNAIFRTRNYIPYLPGIIQAFKYYSAYLQSVNIIISIKYISGFSQLIPLKFSIFNSEFSFYVSYTVYI